MDTHAKKLTISIDINEVAEARINEIKQILDQHKGDGRLHFQIFEPKEELYVKMPSRKQKIKISPELLSDLEAHTVHYKVN